MSMDKAYGGIRWTDHALQRLRDRGIKQGDAWATWRRPDQSRKGNKKGVWVYYRTYGDQKIEVVARQNERKEWLILSVWSKPVYQKPQAKKSNSLFKLLFNKIFKK